MPTLLVASDSPGAGKTATSLALAQIFYRSGAPARAFEPFPDDNADSQLFARLANASLDGWTPRRVGDSGLSDSYLADLASALAASGDAESVSVLEMPSSVGAEGVARAAEALDAKTLLVAAARRDQRGGDLSAWRDALGDRLAGAIVNGVTRYLGTEAAELVAPSFADSGIELFGMIPEDRFMLSITVEQAREALGGRYAVEEGDTDSPITVFQVGGMSLDPGELRFGLYENNAVVARGDRPDIQMPALSSSVSCLVLTGGIDPIEYISYEAREEETPVIVVEPDTLTTMTLLNDVTASPRMDSARKASRFADLLAANVDVERLRSAAIPSLHAG